jgi:hypothetical protein
VKPLYYRDDIFLENFWVFIDNKWDATATEKYLRNFFNFENLGFENAGGKTIEFYSEKEHSGCIVIWIKPGLDEVNFQATLAHECMHATNFVLRKRGVPSGYDNDEIHCYYTSMLLRKILGQRKKKRK